MSSYKESDRFTFKVASPSVSEFTGDVLVIPFYKPADKKEEDMKNSLKAAIPTELSEAIKDAAAYLIESGEFSGNAMSRSTTLLSGPSPVRRISLLGLGPSPKKDPENGPKDVEVKSAGRIGKMISMVSKDTKAASVGVVFSFPISNAGLSQCILGVYDGAYDDVRYRKVPEKGNDPFPLLSLSLLGLPPAISEDLSFVHSLSSYIASGVSLAKDLVGSPPNYKNPLQLAAAAKTIAAENNLDITILEQKDCEERCMGGYLGVQQGSMYPPQFVHMTYKPSSPSSDVVKVALVGKGLTFDSGGYNLKAGAGSMIELMKFDMGGCAAVFGAAKSIGQLRPTNVEVHFISAICENMISEKAMRPGDILVTSNGKTIEVLNTDAEGRLTLADALVYADKLEVDYIIDLATLTGAAIVALGDKMAALYSPDNNLRGKIEAAARRTDEGIWSLPLPIEYKDLLKSTQADLKNIGGRGGGSITAALFLQEFVEKAKWAHIDMAGPVWDGATNKPTGYGVKLLTDFILNLQK
eukprot:CAMPEP_0182426076 /NCGR_PEP_ID=MMETSP1167-20130531/12556_1 /TAXON_ID=2988 /ORGANISM="Mallomonas Sp, Strain CCMP3275" /LENGTH=524 /DNA_ID=CAMNT_0024607263 /DNA_START=166 /DNA_END=1740 /DNA_ORIENTATION=-